MRLGLKKRFNFISELTKRFKLEIGLNQHMSQQELKPTKTPINSQAKVVTNDTNQVGEDTNQTKTPTTTDSIWSILKMIFESSLYELKPVNVVGDKVNLKEEYLKEDEYYPFSYQGKDYLIKKKKEKLQIFEIKG